MAFPVYYEMQSLGDNTFHIRIKLVLFVVVVVFFCLDVRKETFIVKGHERAVPGQPSECSSNRIVAKGIE